MGDRPAAERLLPLAMMLSISIGSAAAQTCDTLLGGTNCGARSGSLNLASRDATGPGGLSVQSLGRDLSVSDDRPGYFAGITFQDGKATCSGLLRSRSCSGR